MQAKKFEVIYLMNRALKEAYRQAKYILFSGSEEILFKVGLHSNELDNLLVEHGVINAVFITAYNPRSQIFSDEENKRQQINLEKQIERAKYRYLKGASCSEDGLWPIEKSLLILDMPLSQANSLAISFKQNAYLQITQGEKVALVFTFDDISQKPIK